MSDALEQRSADKVADTDGDENRGDEVLRDEIDSDEIDDDREPDDIDDDDTPAIQPARPLIDRRSDRDVASETGATKADE